MRSFRISIAGLLVFILLLGVAFAGLHAATERWAEALLTFALASIGVALLGVLFAAEPGRAAWAGYLVFCAGYLGLCIGPWFEDRVMPHLLTTAWIDAEYAMMEYSPRADGERVWVSDRPGDPFVAGRSFGSLRGTSRDFDVALDRGTTSRYRSAQMRGIGPASYRRLCHSVAALLLGLVGSLLARRFAEAHPPEDGRAIASVAAADRTGPGAAPPPGPAGA